MIMLFASFLLLWICLFLTGFIKEERTGAYYTFTLKEFTVIGNVASWFVYVLWIRGLTGQTLFYVSIIIFLFIIQAAIDWKYQEIALEWVGLSFVSNGLLMWHLNVFSYAVLWFVLSIFILLFVYALYVGFGLGDVLIISSNLLLLTPLRVPSNPTLFWYTDSYRNFLLVFMIAQLLAWGYMIIKKQAKKGQHTAFMPWYTVTFIGWFYFGLF